MNIFVSFHAKDWSFFDRLSDALRQSGHAAYYIDLRGRLGEKKIFDFSALDDELRNTDIAIVVLSKRYIGDAWLADEIRALMAMENNQRPNFLVPILIDDLNDEDIPNYLRSKTRYDFRTSPFEAVYADLAAMLSNKKSRSGLLIFISHSHENTAIAQALLNLLLLAFNISKSQIRCTSVDGFRLHVGANVDRLKVEIYEARVFIGLITPESIRSVYVLFELGARWGAKRQIMPVLAGGADADILGGPLGNINALSCNEPDQVHQPIDDIAEALKLEKRANYVIGIKDLVRVSSTARVTVKPKAVKKATGKKNFKTSPKSSPKTVSKRGGR